MKHFRFISALALLAIVTTSCDDHVFEDVSWRTWKPGMVYSSNGDVTSYEKCIEKGNIPEAVIFYVDNDESINGKAYAVSLHDMYESYFSDPDTICVSQGTSASIEQFDGEQNTTTLRYGNIMSPIAMAVNAKYFIPSVAEMYKLFVARSEVNRTLEKCDGDLLPVDDMDCWYWTSTECEMSSVDRAWRFSMYSGRFESVDKRYPLPSRPIMTIRLNAEE